MHTIQSTNSKKWRWISALVITPTEAESQLLAIPEHLRHHHRIVEIPFSCFPVFMIEDNGFKFGDLEFIRHKLHNLKPTGDDNHVHLNVYAFKEAFAPERPGRDEMGRLLHWHVTDSTLRPPRAEVFDAEIAAIASDA
jgi:hypothetical protein